MPRGKFTQCFCVLLKETVTLDAVLEALKSFTIRGTQTRGEPWPLGASTINVEFRPEVNGIAQIDIIDERWPDSMGDPKKEPDLFAAWTGGEFGPMTYPGSLLRATQQSWGWKEGRTAPDEHAAFLRLRISYVLGAGDDAPLFPKDWDSVAELQFLTKLVMALLPLPQALCYFNPNGEVLRDLASMQSIQELAAEGEQIPIDLWINVRIYQMDAGWEMMDTVGNGQLNAVAQAGALDDVRDIEALFPAKKYDYSEIDNFLRDLTQYLYETGDVIQDGHTIKGPGGVEWKAALQDDAITTPPRRAVRVSPADTPLPGGNPTP
jgi:hypothetical protein